MSDTAMVRLVRSRRSPRARPRMVWAGPQAPLCRVLLKHGVVASVGLPVQPEACCLEVVVRLVLSVRVAVGPVQR